MYICSTRKSPTKYSWQKQGSGGGHHNVAVCINPIGFQLGSQVPELNLLLNATDDFHNAPATFGLGGIISDTLPKNR